MTIKANQIHTDVLLISKLGNIHTETMFVPNVWLFSIILLLCEFYPHRQTWYQKFLGTYLPLNTHFYKKLRSGLNTQSFLAFCDFK